MANYCSNNVTIICSEDLKEFFDNVQFGSDALDELVSQYSEEEVIYRADSFDKLSANEFAENQYHFEFFISTAWNPNVEFWKALSKYLKNNFPDSEFQIRNYYSEPGNCFNGSMEVDVEKNTALDEVYVYDESGEHRELSSEVEYTIEELCHDDNHEKHLVTLLVNPDIFDDGEPLLLGDEYNLAYKEAMELDAYDDYYGQTDVQHPVSDEWIITKIKEGMKNNLCDESITAGLVLAHLRGIKDEIDFIGLKELNEHAEIIINDNSFLLGVMDKRTLKDRLVSEEDIGSGSRMM